MANIASMAVLATVALIFFLVLKYNVRSEGKGTYAPRENYAPINTAGKPRTCGGTLRVNGSGATLIVHQLKITRGNPRPEVVASFPINEVPETGVHISRPGTVEVLRSDLHHHGIELEADPKVIFLSDKTADTVDSVSMPHLTIGKDDRGFFAKEHLKPATNSTYVLGKDNIIRRITDSFPILNGSVCRLGEQWILFEIPKEKPVPLDFDQLLASDGTRDSIADKEPETRVYKKKSLSR